MYIVSKRYIVVQNYFISNAFFFELCPGIYKLFFLFDLLLDLPIQLEYNNDRLFQTVMFPMSENTENLERLLEMVHPAQRLPYAVHAAYKPQQGGMFITVANIRELNQPELAARFDCLWKLATTAAGRLA